MQQLSKHKFFKNYLKHFSYSPTKFCQCGNGPEVLPVDIKVSSYFLL